MITASDQMDGNDTDTLITPACFFTSHPYFGKKLDFLFVRGSVCFAAGSHGLCMKSTKIHILRLVEVYLQVNFRWLDVMS